MTATVEAIPASPIAARECKLLLSATTGNFVRVWCTDAPPGSKLRGALDSSGSSRVNVASADAGRTVPFTADKAGAYVFWVEEITKGASAQGGVYDTDPNKAPSEAILGAGPVTIHFAAPLVCLLGVGQDTAELLIHVLNNGIIATTAALHGVVSPVVRNPKTGLAKVAAESSAVRDAVQALATTLASVALGNTPVWLLQLIDAFNAHLTQSGVHANDDTDNAVGEAFRNGAATTTEGQKQIVAALRKALGNHQRNDNPNAVPPGTGSGDYHSSADWQNALLQTAPADQLSVLVSAADAYRAYEAHRLSAVHAHTDLTNVAPAPPPLLALHIAFVRQLATHSPAHPANDNPAAALLLSGGGFKEP